MIIYRTNGNEAYTKIKCTMLNKSAELMDSCYSEAFKSSAILMLYFYRDFMYFVNKQA